MSNYDSLPILPVCFCIHRNVVMEYHISVGGREVAPMDLITNGIRKFVQNSSGANAAFQTEVAIALFSGSFNWIQGFTSVTAASQIPNLEPSIEVDCCLGNALAQALDAIEQRMRRGITDGKKYLKPLLVIVSNSTNPKKAEYKNNPDTEDDGPVEILRKSAARCEELINSQKLTVLVYGLQDYANENLLRYAVPGGIIQSVPIAQMSDVLSRIGSYANEPIVQQTPPVRDASSYILGIYTDVLH